MSQTLPWAPPRRPTSHRKRPNYALRRLVALLAVVGVGLLVWAGASAIFGSSNVRETSAGAGPSAGTSGRPVAKPSPSASPTVGPINTKIPGLTTFRGNATRDWYGEGPLPQHPEILWRYPKYGGMCSQSNNLGATKTWCGTGWTGQPNVLPHDDGTIEIRFGAYDAHYHFLNGMTGEPMRPDLVTGDLAKGSATSDADGYPLYYAGSRDNFFRIVALDRKEPTVLWKIDSNSNPGKVWNDDWDGAALQVGDYLLEGGENSWFYVIRLNRHYDSSGLVQVDPKVVMLVPGFDADFRAKLGDDDISIENSVAFYDGVAYFSNSGGLVQGWDISDILNGGSKYSRVFRFWVGDDVDASIAIDQEGYLYVARHDEENLPRTNPLADTLKDIIKLDPRKPNDPVVWSVQVGGHYPGGGSLSTPALYEGLVYAIGTDGELAAIDQKTGKVYWTKKLTAPLWMSPVPIDHQLLVGDCTGVLHDFDISDPKKEPEELWTVQLEGCIESTPAVWHGMIWVGARGGAMYGIGDPS